jgi:hypothetical protein
MTDRRVPELTHLKDADECISPRLRPQRNSNRSNRAQHSRAAGPPLIGSEWSALDQASVHADARMATCLPDDR